MTLGQPTVDSSLFAPARFREKETFSHFENPEHPDCFACNSRMMLVRPIETTWDYVLLEATTRLDTGEFVVMPYTWLVYPKLHVANPDDMPNGWTHCLKMARRKLGITTNFCTGENWGRVAGQTVAHGHTWIIGRGYSEKGLVTENTGLATLILRAQQHGIIMP